MLCGHLICASEKRKKKKVWRGYGLFGEGGAIVMYDILDLGGKHCCVLYLLGCLVVARGS